MTDKDKELIKRLQDFGHVDAYQAATRIEVMNHELEMQSISLSMCNTAWDQTLERAVSAEAKLAKAVEALRFYASLRYKTAITALAELEA
jgi:hypothetical protein